MKLAYSGPETEEARGSEWNEMRTEQKGSKSGPLQKKNVEYTLGKEAQMRGVK